ncbi:MAG TPA: chaperone modulator CbpM [Kofleriaceae bacterium]|nr:chaperone modulator CbpM [Kofleriaceae bacterium]
MTTTRFSYQHLIELVGGDQELIARLVEEGEIEQRGDVAVVDVDRVLVARTLVRELDVDWAGVEVILRLLDELAAARRRIAELERGG